MKKKLAFIMSSLLLVTAGCSNTDIGNETGEKATAATEQTTAAETAAEETTAEVTTEAKTAFSNGADLFSLLKTGMTEDEVLDILGRDYDCRFETESPNEPYEYNYPIESDEIFGTGLSGYMFVKFLPEDKTLAYYGYQLGAVGNVINTEYPYSEEELAEGYDKIVSYLSEKYGERTSYAEDACDGVRKETSWADGSDTLWASYGIDLMGDGSGVSKIAVSHSKG